MNNSRILPAQGYRIHSCLPHPLSASSAGPHARCLLHSVAKAQGHSQETQRQGAGLTTVSFTAVLQCGKQVRTMPGLRGWNRGMKVNSTRTGTLSVTCCYHSQSLEQCLAVL